MHRHNKYQYLTSLSSNLHFPMSRPNALISSTFASLVSSSFFSKPFATSVLVCNNLLFVALKKAALCLSVGMTDKYLCYVCPFINLSDVILLL